MVPRLHQTLRHRPRRLRHAETDAERKREVLCGGGEEWASVIHGERFHAENAERRRESVFSASPRSPRETVPCTVPAMIVHLIDGTYELFRHFYGIRRFRKDDPPFGAVAGVLGTVVQMLEGGATHIGVATDHVIESFRNDLWPGYKTGAGIDHALWRQFHPLEEALVAMGVVTWAMVELEADDALASAAHLAAADARVEKVCIWTPDKDLAQCVVDDR